MPVVIKKSSRSSPKGKASAVQWHSPLGLFTTWYLSCQPFFFSSLHVIILRDVLFPNDLPASPFPIHRERTPETREASSSSGAIWAWGESGDSESAGGCG